MRRYSANYVYTNTGEPVRNGIVGVDTSGVVVEIIDPKGKEKELASTEFHNGVIVPGFVNAHCHTELSHMKSKINPGGGLAQFVNQVRDYRLKGESYNEDQIKNALYELNREGVVAVADISNTSDSFSAKLNSQIRFTNFIEVLGIDKEMAEGIMSRARLIANSSGKSDFGQFFITPHSVYSLSQQLWELLSSEIHSNPLISIHFAESELEGEFTKNRKGGLANNFESWGLPIDDAPIGEPIEIAKKYLPKDAHILFVHNTFLSKTQAQELKRFFPNAYLVLCPGSNLYIENSLPDIPTLQGLGLPIALGTDSLASSNSLSILDQMLIIQKHFPKINFSDILKWATIGGAEALGIQNNIGTIELAKTPGLNLLYPFNFSQMKPEISTKVRKLI